MRSQYCSHPIVIMIVVVLSVLALGTQCGMAQEAGIFVGRTDSTFHGPWSLRDSSYFGGSYEHPLWYGVGFEQRLGYMLHFPEATNTSIRTGSLLSDTNITLNLPFHFMGLIPYVTAGAGFVHTFKSDPNRAGTNFDLNYGGGIKYFIPYSPLGVRFDLRMHQFIDVFSQKDVKTLEYSAGILFRSRRG
jgi:hypothetical protein